MEKTVVVASWRFVPIPETVSEALCYLGLSIYGRKSMFLVVYVCLLYYELVARLILEGSRFL